MQSRLKLLSSTALAAAAIIMAVPTASAQDIGALEKRVKALEKSGGGQNVTRSKKSVKLVVNGHIYRAVSHRDNGTTSGFVHLTPNASRTRVRWLGTGKVNDDVTIKTVIELGNSDNVGNAVSLGSGDTANDALDTRVVEIRVQSKSMGTVYLGQGYPAQASQYGADFSGTGVISLNGQSVRLVSGGELFQNNGASVGRTVISAFNVFDTGRRDRIRYDTPKFGGFQVRVDHQNDDAWGISANYGATIGGVKLAARIGHQDSTARAGDSTVTNGSVAVLLPMGLSLAFSAGESGGTAGTAADAAEYRYAKIGYKFKGLGVGQTRLFAAWHQMTDFANIGEEATSWELGVVQIVEPLGAELVFAYHDIDLDLAAGAASDTITAVTVGLRAKF